MKQLSPCLVRTLLVRLLSNSGKLILLFPHVLFLFRLGRAYKDRSGLGAAKTKFTDGSKQVRNDGKDANYTPGGSSWTERWLIFDNSYFTTIPDPDVDPELLKLSSDRTLFDDADFKQYAEKFRDSQDEFFKSYAVAHKKLSELGSKFEPEEGIKL
jgi:L-ascorbate peroxidase